MISSRFFPLWLVLFLGLGCQHAKSEFLAVQVPKTRTIAEDSLTLIPEKGLVYYQGKPFSGTSFSRYPNGKLATQIEYLGGKKQGYYRKWFEDGTLNF